MRLKDVIGTGARPNAEDSACSVLLLPDTTHCPAMPDSAGTPILPACSA